MAEILCWYFFNRQLRFMFAIRQGGEISAPLHFYDVTLVTITTVIWLCFFLQKRLHCNEISTNTIGVILKEKILTAYSTLHGQITWDEENNGELPLCVINGKGVTWKDLGHELMTYEGFHFELHIHDDENIILAK
ncbi:MAG: hypothetical protein ACI9Y1_002406 [Lentisphaeria bacterium]